MNNVNFDSILDAQKKIDEVLTNLIDEENKDILIDELDKLNPLPQEEVMEENG